MPNGTYWWCERGEEISPTRFPKCLDRFIISSSIIRTPFIYVCWLRKENTKNSLFCPFILTKWHLQWTKWYMKVLPCDNADLLPIIPGYAFQLIIGWPMMFKGFGVLPQRACGAFVWTQTLLAQLLLPGILTSSSSALIYFIQKQEKQVLGR